MQQKSYQLGQNRPAITFTHIFTCPNCNDSGFSANTNPKNCTICALDFEQVPVVYREIEPADVDVLEKPKTPELVVLHPDSPDEVVVLNSLLVGVDGTELVIKVHDKEEKLEGHFRLTPEEAKNMARMLTTRADAIIAGRQRNRRR